MWGWEGSEMRESGSLRVAGACNLPGWVDVCNPLAGGKNWTEVTLIQYVLSISNVAFRSGKGG